ncbi:MAG: hypothetical protein AAF602_27825, partial [Myxococcota bacterium]
LITSRVDLGGPASLQLEPLELEEATRLFLRRAHEVRETDAFEPGLVRSVVAAVSGVPLGLELAAARLRLIDLDALAQDLERDLAVLGQRSGSIEGILEATWASLDAIEHRVLAVLARIQRPLDAVALMDAAGIARWPLLDALDTLVRAALVVERDREFSVLDLVASFVAPREPAAATDAFGRWLVVRAQALTTAMREDPAWTMDALAAEVPTLRAAAERTRTPADRAAITLALAAYDTTYGRPGRSAPMVQSLDLDALPPPLAIDVMDARTRLAKPGTAPGEQVPLAREALHRANAEGHAWQRARAWNRLVFTRMVAEGAPVAAEDMDRMLDAAKADGVPWSTVLQGLMVGADVSLRLDALDRALGLVEQAWAHTSPDTPMGIHVLARRASLLQLLGRADLGVGDAQRAYDAARTMALPGLVLLAGQELVLCAHAAGDLSVVEEALPTLTELAEEADPSLLSVLALARSRREPPVGALRSLDEAIRRAHASGRRRIEGLARLELGYLAHLADGPELATVHYGDALEAVRDTDWHHVRAVAQGWSTLAALEATGEVPSASQGRRYEGLAGAVQAMVDGVVDERPEVSPEAGAPPLLMRTATLAARARATRDRRPRS